MNFLKNVLATIVGLIVFSFVSFFLLIIVSMAFSAGTSENVAVKNNSVIDLDLEKVYNDYGGKVYIEDFQYREVNKNGLVNVLNAIEYAKTDDNIKGITLFNIKTSLGITQLREVREKLDEFKKTGKFVVAYSDNYTQGEYYVSSVADTVYVNPVGGFDFKGLASEILYMKELQQKTGVKMEVIRHGKYKSAVEPYLEQHMSPENREQITVLLNSIWDTYVTDIAATRKIPVDTLNAIANNLAARTPELAKEHKLVDKVAYVDQFSNGIRKALGVDYDKEYNEISILDYVKATDGKMKLSKAKDRIAVVYAQGEIRGGEGSVDVIGEGSVNRALFEARNDDNVKAVVLRVNSPGGSALTSDLILREIELTKKVKPVIVSMGAMAASGGYYISSKADYIFAEPGTITGSIGVFGMLPNFEEVATKFGVNAEQVKTHENSVSYSPFKKLDPKMRGLILEDIERVYTTFVNHVAAGRKMTYEQVDAIGQGRVWTGKMAKEIGLVDELGGLDQAIAYAAKKAEIKDYRLVSYPEYEIKLEDLFRKFLGISIKETQDELIAEKIGYDNYEMLQRMNYLKQTEGIQALLPYQIIIR
ncbi:signal peptide peptidase SppA [Myroides ceti]|uniref:Signal peptide peptidase SppA n=1 Tax=Paenimyroides ceti TaxID=395087 RepID=A0ABT8CS23_9FLAO|nr:signal peptide peptidase SppA [Paenimyroides ceti]MDN3706000.1 signal peptide peptidase SppA [Paenimyroides ceti]